MQEFSFSTFPELATDRLNLRQLTFDDVKPIFRLRSNKEINELITRETPKNLSEAEAFIDTCLKEFTNENSIFWGLELQSTGQLIGTICLHRIDLENNFAEVGYEVNPDFQDEGYMSEAMNKVLDFSIMTLSLKNIEAFTHQNNTASIALLEKYLFVLQPERRDEAIEDNRIYKFGS
ncbi:GNAT family N-acetyltransferase [Polaribacter sp. PL03]|uniref:GNAT family N-acetyltransferase n=1 Tax=Polaribacter sp. PL03 TaxID=3088353 RepID=UPI0029CAF3C3|nr:GNAT family N-acetyltransferase [Polaribacter sp. PL03]MDX6746344.1 GNAT family N-acetyltransferase [Polaribacter sp. PL03]